MINAMLAEVELQRSYLNQRIDTIYFGGGTPSLLIVDDINRIIDRISRIFKLSDQVEVTLEANPDDLTIKKLKELKNSSINRLSIGIQTFDQERLHFINRAHTSEEAYTSIKQAQDSGFTNLSIDLIYAIPPDNIQYWENDLKQTIELKIPHVSLYGLTIEPKTVFGKWKEKGILKEVEEDIAARQYKYAINFLTSNGFQQYEVANFCKPGYRSQHNNAYWNQKDYLGIGPGAHSFNGKSRQYNVRNNANYIKSILSQGSVPFEIEELDTNQKINEYILTRLRTMEGIHLEKLCNKYGYNLTELKNSELNQLSDQGLIEKSEHSIVLSIDGLMVADEIALILMPEE